MKKFSLLVVALIGICSCLNLSSCSKDDKNDPSTPEVSVKMRPISIIWERVQDFGIDKLSYLNISYYEDNKIKSYIEEYKDYETVSNSSYEYEYNDNSIVLWNKTSNRISETRFGLKNGLIIECTSENLGRYEGTYEYENNCLKLKNQGNSKIYFQWENGNIVKRYDSDGDGYAFSYTEYNDYRWVPTMGSSFLEGEIFENGDQFLVSAGYYGKIPQN